ncbi:polysaccharide biosynthesis/export family protein [Candidatus Nitronereus thalassa]|uniref:Polysaccharide export protein n=1 Tax=Candidatus Nitronereus thalassa TaxID=3020898 RepID=A0ABU3K5E1_9BACT|nr:polysaccharide biosynthesis/export family protein [Candidatus Nitronereus thalassa]MDT7041583.1 polysaccharide export protein [Candidatus Nitronereus thalassa]
MTVSLVLLLMAVGCAYSPFSSEPPVADETSKVVIPSYQVGPNDVLRVEVFDEPDLLTETAVSGLGVIKFPLLGELRVAGMTVKEVEETLAKRLEDGYLKNPKVTVSILTYRNFFISGEARNPGAYPYREGLTVLKAITLAGGWTERAVKDEAKMLRDVNGNQQMLTVDMNDFVQPDDIIIVPESFF